MRQLARTPPVPAVRRLILDSLRYWANDVQIDGFRFDLAATLGRDAEHEFQPDHPLLRAILDDPQLGGVKMIAEPWDVGHGRLADRQLPRRLARVERPLPRPGAQLLAQRHRDRARARRRPGRHRRLRRTPRRIVRTCSRPSAGRSHPSTSSPRTTASRCRPHRVRREAQPRQRRAQPRRHRQQPLVQPRRRGPDERRGSSATRGARRCATCSARCCCRPGMPMLTAGDEFGRTQRGNNNAYCHDTELTWLPWERERRGRTTCSQVRGTSSSCGGRTPRCARCASASSARPIPSATQMDWYNKDGESMSLEDWDSPAERTLQYLAASTPEFEEFNRILLIVHGLEEDVTVTLPAPRGCRRCTRCCGTRRIEELDERGHRPRARHRADGRLRRRCSCSGRTDGRDRMPGHTGDRRAHRGGHRVHGARVRARSRRTRTSGSRRPRCSGSTRSGCSRRCSPTSTAQLVVGDRAGDRACST